MKCKRDLGFEHVNSPRALGLDLQSCRGLYTRSADMARGRIGFSRSGCCFVFFFGENSLPCIYLISVLNVKEKQYSSCAGAFEGRGWMCRFIMNSNALLMMRDTLIKAMKSYRTRVQHVGREQSTF